MQERASNDSPSHYIATVSGIYTTGFVKIIKKFIDMTTF